MVEDGGALGGLDCSGWPGGFGMERVGSVSRGWEVVLLCGMYSLSLTGLAAQAAQD